MAERPDDPCPLTGTHCFSYCVTACLGLRANQEDEAVWPDTEVDELDLANTPAPDLGPWA